MSRDDTMDEGYVAPDRFTQEDIDRTIPEHPFDKVRGIAFDLQGEYGNLRQIFEEAKSAQERLEEAQTQVDVARNCWKACLERIAQKEEELRNVDPFVDRSSLVTAGDLKRRTQEDRYDNPANSA